MENFPNRRADGLTPRVLLGTAVVAWLVSLALPGFSVQPYYEPVIGAYLLFPGLLFAWMSKGWAVYANVFFLFAAFMLLVGERPIKSVLIMLAFAATMPLCTGVPDVLTSTVWGIVSWGWGAVVWVCALLLLACAGAMRARVIGIPGVKIVLLIIAVAIAAVLHIHLHQWRNANDQEREIYLNRGMAFTRVELCGLPLSWPNSRLIPNGTAVIVDIEPGLRLYENGKPYLRLPTFLNYREEGYDWSWYHDPLSTGDVLKIRHATSRDRPVLSIKSTAEGAAIHLIESGTGRILYEQLFRKTSGLDGRPEFCPRSSLPGWKGFTTGADSALLRAIGEDQLMEKERTRAQLNSESARQICNVEQKDTGNVSGLAMWDGRHVVPPKKLYSFPGFCSENYIGLVEWLAQLDSAEYWWEVHIFERKTLKPIAMFRGGRPCAPQCTAMRRDEIKGIRISDLTADIETARGEFLVNRIR